MATGQTVGNYTKDTVIHSSKLETGQVFDNHVDEQGNLQQHRSVTDTGDEAQVQR